jgi:hypothetical protein
VRNRPDDRGDTTILATRTTRTVMAGIYLLGCLGLLGGLLDPTLEGPPGQKPVLWSFFIMSAYCSIRVLFVGVEVTDDSIIVRSLCRTRRIDRRDLRDARAVRYAGGWRLSAGRWVMLELQIRRRREPLEVPNVFAQKRSQKVQRIAARLRELRSSEPQELQPTVYPTENPANRTQQTENDK